MRKTTRRLPKRVPSLGLGRAGWLVAVLMAACHGQRPADLGVSAGRFSPCPSSPNCVSSDEKSEGHRIAPFVLAVPAAEGWAAAVQAVSELEGASIAKQTGTYLHAQCNTRTLGFVDDLQLHLRPADRVIAVRSASRVGYWDLGVNRRRVEQLRRLLLRRGASQ